MEIHWAHGNIAEGCPDGRDEDECSQEEENLSDAYPVPPKETSWLSSVPVVEGVMLRVYPTYSLEGVLHPKVNPVLSVV